MAGALIEAVPNFSEGRDAAKVDAIAAAAASVRGVCILRTEMDPDHNRSVITFAGPPAPVEKAAFRAISKAAELIDLREHRGEHPRMGACDVMPLVPLENATLGQCAAIAHRLGQRVWDELHVPVYFYEAAALTSERKRLENVRRGGFENPRLTPDIGGPALHASAGACIIGARQFLIAFNVNLDTADVHIAREIARAVRQSSGGLPHLKAIGLKLASRNIAQVSMNLTDFETTGLHAAFAAVAREATARGVGIRGSEIVGLVPRRALEFAAADALRIENFGLGLVLEDRIAAASKRRTR